MSCTSSQIYFNQQSRDSLQRNQSNIEKEIWFQGLHSNKENYTYLNDQNHSTPLDLKYKEASPRADTEIQILLLPKGSNPDTFREERLVSKKNCMIRNIANLLLASALLPDRFCNKNNAISPEAIKGETTKTSTQRMAPIDRKVF